ncbi:MAG: DEAD/DEAH box helicase [Candidatus Woesearchaeota archaeon]
MWSYLKRDDVDNFLNEYPNLKEDFYSLCLLTTKNEVFLPRLMADKFKSNYLHKYYGKKENEPEKVNIKFQGELKDKQKPVAGKILEKHDFNKKIQGIIKLPPGFGKTVLSIFLLSKIGFKTCIIVDNSDLLGQWIKEIIKFTDLTEDDIGIIKQKLFVTDKKVTLAMSQSLLSKLRNNFHKTFTDFDNANFGLVIYDEVHRSSASQEYAKISIIQRTTNTIGLSATPFHTGVQKILMENTIGPLIYESSDYEKRPKYYLYYYHSNLDKYKHVASKMGDFIKKRGFYNKIIPKSETYLASILYFTKMLMTKGHTIAILCLTKDQINTISKVLEKNGITHRRFYGDEREIDKENDQVVVMSYKFAGTGFDMKSLSAMILACPLSGKKSLIQSIGRILREDKDKQDPIVVDFIDKTFSFLFFNEINRKKSILKNEFGGENFKINEIDEQQIGINKKESK